jgi:uncharacterized membrane protein
LNSTRNLSLFVRNPFYFFVGCRKSAHNRREMLLVKAHSVGATHNRTATTFALWTLLAIYAIARVLQIFPGRVPMLAVVALHVIPPALFALFDGAVRYSLRGMIVFFVICLIVGGAVENIGVLTGIPFGPYYFTPLMGPKILVVPVLLALAYVGMAYLSWTLALLILRQSSNSVLAGSRAVTVPLIASFIMVAWDVAMDPVWSTVLHAWIWRDGGIYFGVPISNFLGWFFTVYLILQSFALYVRNRSTSGNPLPRNYWNLAILFYATSAAGNLLLLLPRHGPAVVFDPTGAQWQVAGITAATAVVSVFGMGAFALLAWFRSQQ